MVLRCIVGLRQRQREWSWYGGGRRVLAQPIATLGGHIPPQRSSEYRINFPDGFVNLGDGTTGGTAIDSGFGEEFEGADAIFDEFFAPVDVAFFVIASNFAQDFGVVPIEFGFHDDEDGGAHVAGGQ